MCVAASRHLLSTRTNTLPSNARKTRSRSCTLPLMLSVPVPTVIVTGGDARWIRPPLGVTVYEGGGGRCRFRSTTRPRWPPPPTAPCSMLPRPPRPRPPLPRMLLLPPRVAPRPSSMVAEGVPTSPPTRRRCCSRSSSVRSMTPASASATSSDSASLRSGSRYHSTSVGSDATAGSLAATPRTDPSPLDSRSITGVKCGCVRYDGDSDGWRRHPGASAVPGTPTSTTSSSFACRRVLAVTTPTATGTPTRSATRPPNRVVRMGGDATLGDAMSCRAADGE
mmetsp:Transcript_8472/g.27009  ORF Transcript_8472/g.27009 Transcript_8472/m.27009 type:complete len:280 (-) Transcript_8472:46-885(-)